MDREIHSFIKRKLKGVGDVWFSYFMMSKNSTNQPYIISNYPEAWMKEYIKKEMFLSDPIIVSSLARITPFSWDDNDLVTLRAKNQDVFISSVQHDISSGYTFVLHDHDNNVATLSIANHLEDANFEKCMKNHENDLQMLLVNVHEKAMAYQRAINVQDKPPDNSRNALLSPRETEVLFLVSSGRTYKEVSRILGISEVTVKFHINNSVRKLDVINSRHAITKALELNLFHSPCEPVMMKHIDAR
ncbi:LuxR family transcriptional regulator [Pectobacterium aroidearum]|uniref:LuxR family transcriptional regulator n=1 Tax=Pectobacterium aroidearum TaxID=1201031 RepID=A0ABR5ZJ31_9GAMM|nr:MULTISPECIES: carbapenem biosynthesis transcriptional regulator CarR [Pectobacterium]MBA5201841.1 LuxR family transcriptional regulator [Pectobacterium aroidearum]MBA5230210.1 LuxR family transcriptional regulator [Pectobacterium aroidearum]MBA5234588.1 LuxR family transcriptional regulator [Pectobacterium aroidearum]MBA5739808.1 LuxR family transcriptional regulator [Pectobacterium aroidearum]MBG0753076.1 Transcriptional activator protein CarR [Pectobacterium carotovorum subsp. carotovorum